MDLYGLLGIEPTATKDEIKKAYRKAALNTHPDRGAPDQKKEREEQFRAVNAAYEILSDDTNRALYDKHRTWPPPEEAQHRSSTHSSSQRRAHPAYDIRQQQRMFAYFNMRAAAPAPFFMFTDPISLFNAIFAQELHAMGMRAAAASSSSSIPPSSSARPVEQSYSRTQQYLPASSSSGTRPPTSVQTSTTTTTTTTSRNGTTTSTSTVTKDGGFSDGAGGWIKESKVIKLSPTGARETTIKKTDYDGTVYITRINGDGVESYAVSINGRETPMSKPGPSRPLKGPHAFSASRSQPAYNERVTQHGSTSQATQYVSYPAAAGQQTTTRRSPPGTNYAVADPPPPDPAKHHTMSAKPQSNRTSPTSGYQTSSSSTTATYVPAPSTTRTSPTNYQPAPNPTSTATTYVPAQRKSPTTYEPAPAAPTSSNDLRRNNSMPSASAVPNHIASMPRPQSPFSNFHSRQRLAAESSQPIMANSGSNKTPPTSDRESDREKYRSQSRSASKTRGPVDDREVAYEYSTKVRASSRSADPQPRAATSASAYTTTFSNQKASAASAHPAYAAAVPSAQVNYAAYDKSRTASSAAQGVEYGRSQTSQGYTAPVRPPSAMARPGSAMPHARAGVDLAQQAQQAARQPRPSGPPTNGLGLEAVPPVSQTANIAGSLPPVSGSQHRMKSFSYDQMPRPAAGNPMAAYAHPGMPVYNFNPMVAPAAMDPWAAHQDALYHKKRMQQV